MSSPKSFSVAMAIPRSVSSIAIIVGGLAIFLIMASLLLVSNPIASSFRDYFPRVDSVGRSQPPNYSSFFDNRTQAHKNFPQEDRQDRIFKEDDLSNNVSESDLLSLFDRGRATPKSKDGTGKISGDVGNSIFDNSSAADANSTSGAAVPSFSFFGGNVHDGNGSSLEVSMESVSGSGFGNKDANSTDSDGNSVAHDTQVSFKGGSKSCDLYRGKWVHDTEGPLYSNNSCPIITQMQNCQGNGRPDKDYENWRWKPDQCDLPRFDARKFLELMRGKTLAFVGDSVSRNQMESLICILWQVEAPKNRGNRRMHRFYFRSTSTMIVRIWSSWLVHKTSESMEFAPEGVVKLHLDIPDEEFMEFLPSFDVVVLSSGHWFAKQSIYMFNGTILGGQLWKPPQGSAIDMRINNMDAFGVSVETALSAIAAHPKFKGLAVVRSYSPDHYEGGAWNTGGSCTGKVSPVIEVVRNEFTAVMHEKQVTGYKRAIEKAGNNSSLVLMDITEIFGYRPDGHPGPYRSPDPNKKTKRGPNGEPPPQDCLHWCMPGPIDTWNELLMEIIRRDLNGSR